MYIRIFACLLTCVLFIGPASAESYVDDSAGRLVKVPSIISRIVPAGPPAAIMLYTLAPAKLAGWPCALTDAQRRFVRPPHAELPTIGRLVGGGAGSCLQASHEAVLALRPDLIVDAGAVTPAFSRDASTLQERLGIPYLLFNADFDQMPSVYRKLGAIIGEKDRGEEIGSAIANAVNDIRATAAGIPEQQRPRVYVARGRDGYLSGLRGSHELITMLGATNVVPNAGQGRPVTVSPEQLLSWDPDIIVMENPQLLSSLATHSLWGSLRAVQNRRVFLIPSLPFDWLDTPPSVNRIMGLYWLGHIFYPDKFTADLNDTAREFYRTFYGVALGAEELSLIFRDALPRR